MHIAFETDTDDPAFRPEPVSADDIQSWAAAAQETGHRALEALTDGTALDPQAQELAEALLARRDKVVDRLQAMLGEVPAFSKTRHHGDYHLGQVLVTGRDAVIIDFEGEPLRPLAERRAKHSALRDVAGMLRSFAYAAAAASRALPRDLSQPERNAVEDRLAAWEAEASQAFLDAYFETARGSRFCPADRADADRVVRFFMLEKALYEIAYELANRPDWVAIPLCGILALLEKETAPAPTRKHHMPFGAELQADGSGALPPLGAAAPRGSDRVGRRDGRHANQSARAGTNSSPIAPAPVRDIASCCRMACAFRTRPRAISRRTCTGRARWSIRRAYVWRDAGWSGRPWHEAVVYELHIGAFTPEGTFRAAIAQARPSGCAWRHRDRDHADR